MSRPIDYLLSMLDEANDRIDYLTTQTGYAEMTMYWVGYRDAVNAAISEVMNTNEQTARTSDLPTV